MRFGWRGVRRLEGLGELAPGAEGARADALAHCVDRPVDLLSTGPHHGHHRSNGPATSTFDAVAELTVAPDERFDELRDRYESDPALRMDGSVFSVALGEHQQI